MKLELYVMKFCPFCIRVKKFLERKGIDIPTFDIHQDADAHQRLLEVGGKDQVPCLFIDGKPLYESKEIIQYLKNI